MMRWVEDITCKKEIGNSYNTWSENLKERDHAEDLGVNVRTVSEWILGK
jgi:hypothetical protein